MRNAGLFSEKVCITASSQDHAHRAPVSLTTRRGVIIFIIAVLVVVFGLSAYVAVDNLMTVRALSEKTEAFQQTLEAQQIEMAQYEQDIGGIQSTQQAAGQREAAAAPEGGGDTGTATIQERETITIEPAD